MYAQGTNAGSTCLTPDNQDQVPIVLPKNKNDSAGISVCMYVCKMYVCIYVCMYVGGVVPDPAEKKASDKETPVKKPEVVVGVAQAEPIDLRTAIARKEKCDVETKLTGSGYSVTSPTAILDSSSKVEVDNTTESEAKAAEKTIELDSLGGAISAPDGEFDENSDKNDVEESDEDEYSADFEHPDTGPIIERGGGKHTSPNGNIEEEDKVKPGSSHLDVTDDHLDSEMVLKTKEKGISDLTKGKHSNSTSDPSADADAMRSDSVSVRNGDAESRVAGTGDHESRVGPTSLGENEEEDVLGEGDEGEELLGKLVVKSPRPTSDSATVTVAVEQPSKIINNSTVRTISPDLDSVTNDNDPISSSVNPPPVLTDKNRTPDQTYNKQIHTPPPKIQSSEAAISANKQQPLEKSNLKSPARVATPNFQNRSLAMRANDGGISPTLTESLLTHPATRFVCLRYLE